MPQQPDQTRTLTDSLDPARAQALQVTLGQTATISSGEILPPFFHQIYFWDPHLPAALGPDGHPTTDGIIPDMGPTTRMWAAGKLIQHHPLKAGIKAEKISRIEGITRKQGKTGTLTFLRLRHDIRQRHTLSVTEFQDLVYRPQNAAPADPQPAPTVADHAEPLQFSTTQLFRYSAITFNGHRIHYDADYARDTEGYSGLVVHGPLLAHLMMAKAGQQNGPFAAFSYRNHTPLLAQEQATLCGKDNQFWIKGADGRLCASGHIDPA